MKSEKKLVLFGAIPVTKFIALVFYLQCSVAVYAQKRKEEDSLLLRKVLNVEFSFDGIDGGESFQTLSVSLCDACTVEVDTINANAVSDLLLCSEIRGHIEKPNYYFENPKTMRLMLLLPMTGGMKSFNLGDNNRFKITNLDFVDGTPFTVQATTKNGKTSFVQIKIDEDVFALFFDRSLIHSMASFS